MRRKTAAEWHRMKRAAAGTGLFNSRKGIGRQCPAAMADDSACKRQRADFVPGAFDNAVRCCEKKQRALQDKVF